MVRIGAAVLRSPFELVDHARQLSRSLVRLRASFAPFTLLADGRDCWLYEFCLFRLYVEVVLGVKQPSQEALPSVPGFAGVPSPQDAVFCWSRLCSEVDVLKPLLDRIAVLPDVSADADWRDCELVNLLWSLLEFERLALAYQSVEDALDLP